MGEIRLSKAEAERLSKDTAHLYGGEEGYAGVLEVSHQLHCLLSRRPTLYANQAFYSPILRPLIPLENDINAAQNRIRKKFYKVSGPIDDEGVSEKLSHWHDKHCFNYLWQTLLCHADASVMTTTWNEEQQAFNANFAVTKQCRNFDVIHNWAKNREAEFKPPGDAHPGRIEVD